MQHAPAADPGTYTARLVKTGIDPKRPFSARLRFLGACLCPLAAVALVTGRLWDLQGDYPTGYDGGNWVRLGRMLLGNPTSSVAPSALVYPPLGPLLMVLGDRTIGALLSARLFGVASVAAVMIATHLVLVLNRVRPWAAALASLIVGSTLPVVAQVCSGGFPQNLGLAFGIVAVCAAARAVETGARGHARLGAVALVGTALSHHAYYVWTLCVLVVLAVSWQSTPADAAPSPWRALIRVALPSLIAFAPIAISLLYAGYEPRLNPGARIIDAVGYHGFGRSGRRLLPMVALVLYGLRQGPRPWDRALFHAAGALAATGLWSFISTYEPRLLPLVCVGAGLGVGIMLERIARSRLGSVAPVLAVGAAVLFLPAADDDAATRFDRARLVDGAYVQAATWIDGRRPTGLVFVNADLIGFPVGWWLAGLVEAPVVAGVDVRFQAFPATRPLGAAVASVFEPGLTWPLAAQRASENGATLLVTRKADYPGWTEWARARRPAFENESFVAFDVLPKPGPRSSPQ